ncbi:MAG: CCA tRNA nucleotidyltransferase [Methanobacteriota archaeon]|nr:MAG: CCA tRNA nucleotidyltransferase [Euryarchaeota archaeon]
MEREVLRRIKPTQSEDRKAEQTVGELFGLVEEAARDVDASIEPRLVGSVAKDTHLKDPDLDIFMLFPENTTVDELRDKGLEIGRRVLGGEEHYAQHPYVRGEHNGFVVDLVPCFLVRDPARKMSAVDRTPFHTEFIKANLAPSKRDDVRLLKQFMKGIGCYGAEAKVQGFSGYLCELLTMRFDDFGGVLEVASRWRRGEKLALPDHPGKEFAEPLTFVDPVDSSRNVASAVSIEALETFTVASRAYLEEPSLSFFYPKAVRSWSADRITAEAGARIDGLVAVSFRKPDLIDDVLYPQLRKSLSSMTALLRRNDFVVTKTTVDVGRDVCILIEVESMELSESRVHRGPPSGSPNAHEFLAKWGEAGLSAPYEESGRWYVIVEREHRRADGLLREELPSLSLGKDLMKVLTIEVSSGRESLVGRHARALTKHLDERMPWER